MTRLTLRDAVSESGGGINADRAGLSGPLAWVIDGATDVLEAPLLPGGSDAAWFAGVLEAELARLGQSAEPPGPEALAAHLSQHTAARLAAEARHVPRFVHEHPSAAAVLLRLNGGWLEWLALADCHMVAAPPDEAAAVIGAEVDAEVDAFVVAAIDDFRRTAASASISTVRAGIWPQLRARRDKLNQPDGYGVLSTLPVPPEFCRVGRVAAAPGTTILLATDGFTRLADVFAQVPLAGLLPQAREHGLSAMLAGLRALERADADCRSFRRTKAHDDATAILLEITT